MAPVYFVLMHTAVTNRHGQHVTTSVTNLDIHDISRSCRTFGIRKYFVVTPIEDQHELVGRILSHWSTEQSLAYHPDRVAAVSLVQLAKSFDEVKAQIRSECGQEPEVILTDARPQKNTFSYAQMRDWFVSPERDPAKPIALVFGTGWGISEAFFPEVHRILAPVYGPEGEKGYNHLSVRAAAAIILDRLFGR